MLTYILRRTLYSFLVIIGVLILTFVFFRISAGDPALAMLGKNPSPVEIENLRDQLSSDKPLFFGHWRRTEAFTSADFSIKTESPTIKIPDNATLSKGYIRLSDGTLSFKRNFSLPANSTIIARITFRGALKFNGENFKFLDWKTINISFSPENEYFSITPAANNEIVDIRNVKFFKRQDSPFDSQFASAIGEIVSLRKNFPFISFFNFGKTLVTKEDIRSVLAHGAVPSLLLMIPIFIAEIVFSTLFALVSAAFKGKWPDQLISLLSICGISISYLVFIIAGQWYLGYYFNLLPVWGYGGAKYFILPIAVGTLSGLGEGIRFYRTVFVSELNKEYLRTAAAKGCGPIQIYCKHLLANAAIPLISRSTTLIPFLFTGSLLLESFFGIPGLGYAGINAVMNADIQMLKALVIATAFIFVALNLLADIAYAWADPRIRLH